MERIVYADYMRVIGILCVISVHLCGNYLSQTPLFSNLWYQSTIFYSLTRSGVLLFILVSGLLLLDRPQSIDRIPRRVERVMSPFIFWLFIIYIKVIHFDHTLPATSTYEFITQFIYCIINPDMISVEYWYIYMIIGFYLMLPIIQKWISKTDEREIKYFLILWFVILVLNYYHAHIMILNYVNLFTGYLGYFILGYYLNKKDNKYTNSFSLGLLLFVIGTLMVLFSILLPTWTTGHLNLDSVGYLHLAPSSVFKAIGMFLMLKNINYNKLFGSRTESINKYVLKLADISFGLYLIHVLFPFEKILNMHMSPFINIPLGLILIIIVTYILLKIMNKIPIIQRFTGMKY